VRYPACARRFYSSAPSLPLPLSLLSSSSSSSSVSCTSNNCSLPSSLLLCTSYSAVAKPWWLFFIHIRASLYRQISISSALVAFPWPFVKHYLHFPKIISRGPPAAFQRTTELTFGSTGQRACGITCFRLFIPALTLRRPYLCSFFDL